MVTRHIRNAPGAVRGYANEASALPRERRVRAGGEDQDRDASHPFPFPFSLFPSFSLSPAQDPIDLQWFQTMNPQRAEFPRKTRKCPFCLQRKHKEQRTPQHPALLGDPREPPPDRADGGRTWNHGGKLYLWLGAGGNQSPPSGVHFSLGVLNAGSRREAWMWPGLDGGCCVLLAQRWDPTFPKSRSKGAVMSIGMAPRSP